MPDWGVLGAISFPTAALAGLLSFFSPCVLPLVPIYLGYMTGRVAVLTPAGEGRVARRQMLTHAGLFVLGLGSLLTVLGATAGALGHLLQPAMPVLTRVGGVILIILGLQMMGVLRLSFLAMDRRLSPQLKRRGAYGTSFLMGLLFAAGWTPCVGPVLASILLLAADAATVSRGAALLAAYAAGLGIPFIVLAGLADVLGPALRRAGAAARVASVVGGALLAALGLLLLADRMDLLLSLVSTWSLG